MRMRRRNISEHEVEGIIIAPAWRRVTPEAVEHKGYFHDGRLVTDRAETYVVSIIDPERRRRERRYRT